jgi:hypothetical protein
MATEVATVIQSLQEFVDSLTTEQQRWLSHSHATIQADATPSEPKGAVRYGYNISGNMVLFWVNPFTTPPSGAASR